MKLKRENTLDDVDLIRFIVILQLIIVHSFTIYANGWRVPQGIEPCRVYFWIAKLSYSSMLETFVFLSGYLFAFQIYDLKRKYSLKTLINKKIRRLILPSVFFSLLYLICFTSTKEWFTVSSLISVISGRGHLWFLTMLFWCFVEAFLLLNLHIRERYKIVLISFLAIISFIPIPFQIANSWYYLFFFYTGIYLRNNKDRILIKLANIRALVLISILFFMLFIPLTLFREMLNNMEMENLIYKGGVYLVLSLSRIPYAIVGLLFIFVLVNFLIKKTSIKIPGWMQEFNKLSFGIYIYHQFILIFFYYKTPMPLLLGTYLLPIFGFTVALIFSVLLTKLTLTTKFGKLLIG